MTQSTFGFTPFLLDYQADRGDAIVDGEPVRLWVVFENCLFENLRYNDNLIQVTHPSNSVEFRNCTFLDTANLAQVSVTSSRVVLLMSVFGADTHISLLRRDLVTPLAQLEPR